MANLETKIIGVTFENPFIVASSPSTTNSKMIKKALRAGWGSVVLKTIGLEPTPNTCPRMHVLKEQNGKRGMINIELITDLTLEQWLDEIKSIRDDFPHKPLIASIMGGVKPEDWQSVVYALENEGVDIFEANSMQDGIAVVDRLKCDGCALCVGICPTGAISMQTR